MVANKQHKHHRLPFIIAGVLFAGAIGVVCVLVYLDLSAHPSASPGSAEVIGDDGFVEVDWDYWKSVNPDVIGWVTVPGTRIDHPIVAAHKDDPNYYLKHDVYKKYNPYGVPYLDADCEGDLCALNAVVYGHHMNNDSMFSDFANFIDPDYASDHAPIYLQTPDKKMKLDLRYVDVINGAKPSKYTTFDNLTQYYAWYRGELAGADLVFDEDTLPSHVVTFCTCSYGTYKNERTLVVASDKDAPSIVLIEKEVINDQAA